LSGKEEDEVVGIHARGISNDWGAKAQAVFRRSGQGTPPPVLFLYFVTD